ncbi:AAA family ATPase [Pseudomonas asplenii]|uniref:AAA family ATPase n=1 Tax=Pseudomonas asplenii TaxID=53407 RepID=UPI002234CC83|nr:ATP-binding protein [Pseudomonas asplenii]UZE28984.1 ATP-binding protein [Pseudomonas asplenii]
MASGEHLKALLRSHIKGDDSHFLAVAMQMAAHEAKQGHGKLAQDLRTLIDAAVSKRSQLPPSQPVPIGQPRGELSNLLSVAMPGTRISEMVLDEGTHGRLARIISEQRNFEKIRAHGLSPRRKLLLVGPPGTGKTMTASALAGELKIPLYVVRLDSLITKFMGETAAKLRQVFDAIRDTRGIYFFDEFDAIGSQRGLANDVGEIRRVLNSFLQMIEQDQSNSLIIAATNHPEILDYALFRRFDDVIEYGLPNTEQIQAVLKGRLANFSKKMKNWGALADAAVGLSYAELARAADDAIKDAIIDDRIQVDARDVERHLGERKAFHQRKRI